MQKGKIIIIFLLIFIFMNSVNADENILNSSNMGDVILDMTKDSIIKYRWYIEEEVDGLYYPKNEKLDGYYENVDRISYGKYTDWSYDYCFYSKDNYDIDMDTERVYKKIIDAQYIKITNFVYDNNVKIFSNTNEITYEIVKNTDEEVIFDLKRKYHVGDLWLYLGDLGKYNIYFSFDKQQSYLSLSKYIENINIVIPDETWIDERSTYATQYTHTDYADNKFRKCTGLRTSCRVREIKTYRYKKIKKYYDDNYYENLLGYVPDINDYIIEYTGEIPSNTVIITDLKKEFVPVNKYIYLNNDNLYNELDSKIEENNKKEQEKNIEIRYVEKEVIKEKYKISKKVYLLIFILIFIVIVQMIKLFKKNVD